MLLTLLHGKGIEIYNQLIEFLRYRALHRKRGDATIDSRF